LPSMTVAQSIASQRLSTKVLYQFSYWWWWQTLCDRFEIRGIRNSGFYFTAHVCTSPNARGEKDNQGSMLW
jgi:hypothetical protein